jgi:RNA polymerase sigma-70 factor, ECF subfamily
MNKPVLNEIQKEPAEGISTALLQAGDRREFARLVEQYSPRLYRLIFRMLNNPQDAEDALQETFLKVFRHISSFDGRSALSTWLYRIASNEALMVLRRKKPESISLDEPQENEEGEMEPLQIVDWCCIPEHELMSGEARGQLERAIETLPHALRVVFLLRDMENLSTEETAQALNLSVTAVKTRLSRARLRLREQLSAYYGERMEKKQYGAQ